MMSYEGTSIDNFDIGISAEGDLLARIATDFSTETGDVGLRVAVETRTSENVLASLEWVMPTAIALYFGNKYFGTLLEEAAKDHYPLLKKALCRLARRTTGNQREVIVTVISSTSAKVHETDPALLSIWVPLRDSRKAVFRFDHSLSTEALQVATDAMFDALLEYARDEGGGPLAMAPSLLEYAAWAPVILRFDPDGQRWCVWVLDRNGGAMPVR